MGKVEITKEQLIPLIEAKLTERKIAKEIGHSVMSTRKAMKRYGLKTWRARKLRTCLVCGKELTGKQVHYCSGKCKQKKFHQTKSTSSGSNTTLRGKKKKLQFIVEMGGKCSVCGYDKNMSGLSFHHIDRDKKTMTLDTRTFCARSIESLRNELDNCILLCHNCHMELHYPENDMKKLREEFEL